ncbi:unnamed protein product [Absidia cylindrospora]
MIEHRQECERNSSEGTLADLSINQHDNVDFKQQEQQKQQQQQQQKKNGDHYGTDTLGYSVMVL